MLLNLGSLREVARLRFYKIIETEIIYFSGVQRKDLEAKLSRR